MSQFVLLSRVGGSHEVAGFRERSDRTVSVCSKSQPEGQGKQINISSCLRKYFMGFKKIFVVLAVGFCEDLLGIIVDLILES